MDNQHKRIKGYRDLSQDEIDVVNAINDTGQNLETMIKLMEQSSHADKRWVAIARTDLQKGIMALVRSVTRPESF